MLIIAGSSPQQAAAFGDRLRQLSDLGAEVFLACAFVPGAVNLDSGPARVHHIAKRAGRLPMRVRGALSIASASRRIWLNIQLDPEVMRAARNADVIVALDGLAVNAVWELAQRNRHPDAVFGIAPALAAARRRQEHLHRDARGLGAAAAARVGVATRAVRQTAVVGAVGVAKAGLSPAVMRTGVGARFWRTVVGLPRVPDRLRQKMAFVVHTSMLSAGRPDEALRLSAAAVKRLRSATVKSSLLMQEAQAELARGVPGSLQAAVRAALAEADGLRAKGELHKASAATWSAMRLLFHRALHFERPASPLADDPAGYLAGWRQSGTVAALAAPRGRSAEAAAPPADRPLRLLIAVNAETQVAPVRGHFESLPGVELRFLDLAADPQLEPLTGNVPQMIETILGGQTALAARLEGLLRPHLDWADTVLVDGCTAAAVLVSMIDPGHARVVLRLHGDEAYTWWPQLVDYGRVDDLVFVSDRARDLAFEVAPATVTGSRSHVIHQAPDAEGRDGSEAWRSGGAAAAAHAAEAWGRDGVQPALDAVLLHGAGQSAR
jgi:hypothetical protein